MSKNFNWKDFVSGGGGIPPNMCTTDTPQVITGDKIHAGLLICKEPSASTHAVNREYLETNSINTINLIGGVEKVIKVLTIDGANVFGFSGIYTTIGDRVITAGLTANLKILTHSILREKDGGGWGIVYNTPQNEIYVSASNELRLNITALTGYNDKVKLYIEYIKG